MRFSGLLRLTVIVAASIAITVGPSGAQPKEPPPKPRVDPRKGSIELPLERAIAVAQPRPKKGEQALTPKTAIELPVKNAGAVGLAMTGVFSADLEIPVSKGRIERPLERTIAGAQPRPKKGEQALTPKKAIELPVKNVVAGAQSKPIPAAPARAVDQGKRDIELPVKNTIAGIQPAARSTAFSGKFLNPKVEPGKVRWHEDFEAACAASKKSGKPVLLFQMIGKLDDRFC